MPVYFIRAGSEGPVKIGHAGDIRARVGTLQCSHYETLTLLRTMPGGAWEESLLHRHYRPLHIRGEWHRFCPTMLTVEFAPLVVVPKDPEVISKTVSDLITRIDAFLAETSMSQSRFGRLVANDGSLVPQIRAGRNFTQSTFHRISRFIEEETKRREATSASSEAA